MENLAPLAPFEMHFGGPLQAIAFGPGAQLPRQSLGAEMMFPGDESEEQNSLVTYTYLYISLDIRAGCYT